MSWVGPAIAAGSALLPAIMGGGNTQPKIKRVSNLSKGQSGFLSGMYGGEGLESNPNFQQGQDYISKLLSNDPEAFKHFEQPFLTQFNQQIAPGIAERFAGMGTGAGASSSSGLNQSLAQAGSTLQQQLAQLRGSLQMQALPQNLQYASMPYQQKLQGLNVQPYQYYERPGTQGFGTGALSGLAGGFSQGLGQMGGQWAGNQMFGSNTPQPGTPGGVG